MDFLKYLLGNEGGAGQRTKEAMPPMPSLPPNELQQMQAAAAKQGFDPRVGATPQNMGLDPRIEIPLHVRMQHAGIPYSSWPDAAKQELTPKMRAAYEADLEKQNPDMYGGGGYNPGVPREKAMEALLNTSANQAASMPNPSLDALLGSAENTRNRMGATPAATAPPPRNAARTASGAQQADMAYNNKYRELRTKIATGEISEAQAQAIFDREFSQRYPQSKRGNPFG